MEGNVLTGFFTRTAPTVLRIDTSIIRVLDVG